MSRDVINRQRPSCSSCVHEFVCAGFPPCWAPPAKKQKKQRKVDTMKNGIELIAAERERQISAEGWTPEHDDKHNLGQLVAGAICYASIQQLRLICAPCATDRNIEEVVAENWPWDKSWWKPSPDDVRNLVKAGALIAAEIDRLQRIQNP